MKRLIAFALVLVLILSTPIYVHSAIKASSTFEKAPNIKIGKNIIKVNKEHDGYWFKFTAKVNGTYSFLFSNLRSLNKTSDKSDLMCIMDGTTKEANEIVWDNAYYNESGDRIFLASRGCSWDELIIQHYNSRIKQRGEIELVEGETCYFVLRVFEKTGTHLAKGKITCKVTQYNY